jgi:acyl-CoA synthetase (AMP-forming)/AMP-acid ligase II
VNLAVWVERHARRRREEPALADGERVHATWGELAARAAGAAGGLRAEFGLSPGDRVAIWMRNRPEYLEALFGIWHAGLVAVPVNARLHRNELAYILEHSESAVVVTDAEHAGDVEVRVVDEQDRELPAGEAGEVVVRGDVVMAGYWNQPEATAEALRNGWPHTGDVGSFDADGYLTLRDRSKDLIISGGMNIYPREVEEALLRHPGVMAAAVVGRPDTEWGEAVVAFVVADPGAPPSAGDLDQTCLDHIARFKRPKDYRFVDALPTNNYGKVVKRELRNLLRAEASADQA